MNHKNQNWKRAIFSFILGCIVLFACDIQDEQEIIDDPSSDLEIALNESRAMMSEDAEAALIGLNQIVEKASARKQPLFAGKAMWYQAFIYHRYIEDISKAYFSYKESLKFLDQTDDAILKAKVRNNLAILNEYYGQYDMAIDIYSEILKEEDKLEEKQLSNVYYNLGRSYKLKGDEASFFKAEKAFIKSLEISKGIEDHENIAGVNNQVGMMYKDLKDYDMARIAYQNTIRDYSNMDPSSDIMEFVGKAYHGIGVTYMEQEKYDQALSAFEKALEYKKKSSSIFITKYDMGSVFQSIGKTDESIAIWKDALNEKHNKSERVQVEIYAKLTSALAANGEHKEAVKYAQIYNENINNILTVGEKYQAENNQVIFADIIREYDEFNQVIPFYKEPWAIALMFLFIAVAVYAGSRAYYQSKLSTKVSDTRSEIQIEFQNIKID